MLALVLADAATDLRTAVATEHLVTATWVLCALGGATFVAAFVAAIAAVNAFKLEANPAVVIVEGKYEKRRSVPYEQHRVIRRRQPRDDEDQKPAEDGRLLPVFIDRAVDLLIRESEENVVLVEVRNLGRTPVVEANVRFRVTVPEFGVHEVEPVYRRYFGSARVVSIAPYGSAFVPFVNEVGALTLEAIDVTGIEPRVGGKRRARLLPFTSARIPGQMG